MRFDLDHLVLLERPATTPADAPVGTPGDVVEVHCVGGPVMAVNPITRKATTTPQPFVIGDGGSLTPRHTN
jgi:hypothetical protein